MEYVGFIAKSEKRQLTLKVAFCILSQYLTMIVFQFLDFLF